VISVIEHFAQRNQLLYTPDIPAPSKDYVFARESLPEHYESAANITEMIDPALQTLFNPLGFIEDKSVKIILYISILLISHVILPYGVPKVSM
jgi:hypothetical protein